MYIFAYGSNMCFNRLLQRVPSTRFIAIGFIRGFQMKCYKKSIDGSGKGTIIRSTNGEVVWGVVYDIDPGEKHLLDKAEGLNNGYSETHLDVQSERIIYRAQAYVGENHYLDTSAKAYEWYKNFILKGAQENRLPDSYIDLLSHIPSTLDSDADRRKLNEQILNGELSTLDSKTNY